MAAVEGTIVSVSDFSVQRADPTTGTASSVEYQIVSCFVDVTFPAGTYVQADDATFAPGTAIAASRRNGRTPTILQAAFAGFGRENGTPVGAGACTNSSGTVTCPILKKDLATERDAGAMSATWSQGIRFCVSFKEAVY